MYFVLKSLKFYLHYSALHNSFISSNMIYNSYINSTKLNASTCFGHHPPILRRSMFRSFGRDMKLNPNDKQEDFGKKWLSLIKKQHPATNLNGLKQNHE